MARSSVSHSRAARGTRTSPLVCRAALIMFGVVSSLNGALLFRSRRSIHTCTRTAGLPGLVAAFAPPSVRSSVRLPQQQHQHPPRRWLETAVTTTSKTTQSGRWRSPQLSQMQSERRTAPRLYKRTLLRGKKKAETGDMLFRADRVLANRTGKSRKECFQLLQEKRVFRVLEDEESLEGNVRSDSGSALDSETPYRRPRLQVVAGPAAKLSMKAALRIDKYEVVPSPPPLLAVYHKPKVRGDGLSLRASVGFYVPCAPSHMASLHAGGHNFVSRRVLLGALPSRWFPLAIFFKC